MTGKRISMNSKSIRGISIWLVTASLVFGCVLPFLGVSAPVRLPTVQSSQSSEILGTNIAQTAAAAQTLTATALPSLTPTLTSTSTFIPTPIFTSTPTFVFFLHTATPISSETSIATVSSIGSTSGSTSSGSSGGTSGGGGGNSVFTGKEWTCTVISKIPEKGAVIMMGQIFNVYWTVLNTGTKTWTNNGVDFLYSSGLRMDGRHIQDLRLSVKPGSKITLKIQLTAPKKVDTYSTIWALKVGKTSFCRMQITFNVTK
jgi:hypothetical protein